MWNGKMKALTFSFDDGVTQDVRTIEILNRYGLKGTFNLNSGSFGNRYEAIEYGKPIVRVMLTGDRIKEVYKDHEVISHTLNHRNLTKVDDDEVVRQVEEDRKNLEALVGYPVRGLAYPCGGVNNDERVVKILRENTPIRYARTTGGSNNFDLQTNLLQFKPTTHFGNVERVFALAKEFLELKPTEPKLFYIWGHTYELDEGPGITWEEFEALCKLLSGHEDIFYGTNSQVILGEN